MLGIVVSEADAAATHIYEHLLELAAWETTVDDGRPPADGGGTVFRTDGAEMRTFEARHLDLERPATAFEEVDLLVFASKHAGETGPLLTAHHTGNFGPAEHGGEANDLARACPAAHARVLDALATHAPDGYDVGMECTHHGPTDVGAPSMFVEVGSGPDQWADPEAARAVAAAILELRGVGPHRPTSDGTPRTRRHLVGFGGGHYVPRFERLVRETDWAVGHVAADWGLDALGDPAEPPARAVVAAAFARSQAEYALIVGDRSPIREAIADLGYRVVDETWLRETDGVPLDLVHRIESALVPTDATIRFGVDPPAAAEVVTASLPDDLLGVVCGIDLDATRAALADVVLAYVADQGGTRPTGTLALADETTLVDVVEALVDVLRERYESVERTNDELVVRETVFQPERAETLGVPEGPKFGQLAAGETVEVDGRTIPPDAVTETRERRFRFR